MARTDEPDPGASTPGLIVGGRGGPPEELLEDGQEEVFSRTEVLTGRVEHSAGEEADAVSDAPFGRPSD